MKKTITTKRNYEWCIKPSSRIVPLKNKVGDIGKIKYLPSFSNEWKNIVYSYNKNTLKNIPSNDTNINNIIQSYFNLYFKNHQFVGSKKFILLKRRRNFLRRIYVSNAQIKHTNNKAIITLFTVNREKKVLRNKYLKINKKISNSLIKRYYLLYKNNLSEIYTILNKYKDEYLFISDKITKKNYIQHKLEYLNKFIKLKNLYLKKVWSIIINKYAKSHLFLLRKYDLMYSLNQYKFNKLLLLPKLNNILGKVLAKKIEYNIINLKSIAYNTDLFTHALALKLKKKKLNYIKNMFSILNRAYLPKINTIKERTLVKGEKNLDLFLDKYKDLKIISNMDIDNNFSKLLSNVHNKGKLINNNKKEIHALVYNSIGYKNMAGVRLEVKGRLTKRYRADRSVYSLKWKGGLKNINSSFKRLSSVLYRGNSKSNVTYSLATSKRRVGAYSVKGWIGSK